MSLFAKGRKNKLLPYLLIFGAYNKRIQEQYNYATSSCRGCHGHQSCLPWGPVLAEQVQGLTGIMHILCSFHEALSSLGI